RTVSLAGRRSAVCGPVVGPSSAWSPTPASIGSERADWTGGARSGPPSIAGAGRAIRRDAAKPCQTGGPQAIESVLEKAPDLHNFLDFLWISGRCDAASKSWSRGPLPRLGVSGHCLSLIC